MLGEKDPRAPLSTILFSSLSFLLFAYALLAGVSVTADCLSEEKREGTFGLLFLTDLKGYDVVLGKLVATSVNSFYRLVAVFPVLAIPLLLGGLTHSEFWRMTLVLSNTLFFSLSAGCFVSALSRHERKSMAGTFLLILIITAGPPCLGYLLAFRKAGFQYDPTFLLSSAGYAYALAFDKAFRMIPQHFWTATICTHVFGWAFLVLASALAPYSWQDRVIGKKGELRRERWQRWKFGTAEVRQVFRTRLLEVNPFFWLAGRNRLKPAYVLGVLGLGGCVWLWLYLKFRDEMLDPAAYIPTAIILHTLIKFWVASDSCRPLGEDRRSGALELLLSSPLTVDEILRGQILALKRQFGWAVSLILLADFSMFFGGMHDRFLDTSKDWLLLCLAGIVTFLADIYTLAYVGMWLGLTAKKSHRASSGALLRVLVLPWLIFFGLMTTTLFLNLDRQYDSENFILVAWFGIAMLTDLYFFLWARRKLRRELRTLATQPFDRPTPGRRRLMPRLRFRPEPSGEPVKA